LPNVFADSKINSEIWKNEVVFSKGNFYLLEADSGKGKSSLFSFIYGYRNDFFGKIIFDNQNIRSINSKNWNSLRNNSLSLLFQDLRLFSEITALENVLLKTRLTKYKTQNEIMQIFDLLHIAYKANEKCDKLSFGEQQRVAIIRALCQPFDFLLLDEPVSHLDDNSGLVVAELIAAAAQKIGASVIVSSIGKRLPMKFDKIFKL
jgi:ABC-type lipoprotein export system ATPase subunit